MPRPTHDELIRDLIRDVTVLKEQMAMVRREIAVVPELLLKVALLEKQVADMRQDRERWMQRLWMVLGPLVGGAIGALLTYLLNAKK